MQILDQKKMETLDTEVDMTAFASGTYFYKLKINNKEVNFKIVKMN